MTTIKFILIGIAIIIVLLLVIGLFVSPKFQVESEIVINQPNEVVFDYIKQLKNQVNYNDWLQKDPDMRLSYSGEDGTEGFILGWKSDMKNVGVAEQEITKIIEGKRIETELRFKEPFVSTDQAYMTTEIISDNSTRVRFGYFGKMKYPTNLLTPIFKSKIGNKMSGVLEKLKGILEENKIN